MSQRGRPKAPGVLTPREQEVLTLIKGGLSNREIAERLEISLAGAKFHVSEIIGKLGVSNREEAAAWQEKPRGHFGGILALPIVAARRLKLLAPTSKLALASLAMPVLIAGVAVSVTGIDPTSHHRELSSVAAGQSTRLPATPTPRSVIGPAERFDSIADAAARTSFPFKEPSYIPPGFKFTGAAYNRPQATLGGESIVLFYESADGKALTISEGTPSLTWPPGSTEAPEGSSGVLDLPNARVGWIKGGYNGEPVVVDGKLVFGNRTWVDNNNLRLGWYIGSTQEPFDGRSDRLSYSLAGTGLSLDELTRIAESVPPPWP